jgi:hypothetical protein
VGESISYHFLLLLLLHLLLLLGLLVVVVLGVLGKVVRENAVPAVLAAGLVEILENRDHRGVLGRVVQVAGLVV